jgi:hypothetical protein
MSAIPEEEPQFPEESIEHPDAEDQPDTQGDAPLDAELGEDGQGDLAPEDQPDAFAGDSGPEDLRTEAP